MDYLTNCIQDGLSCIATMRPLFAAGAQETFVMICICIFGTVCMLAVPLAIGLPLIDAWSRAKRETEILQLLHDSASQDFTVHDEHFGEDQESAIALDRSTRRFLLWQKQTGRVRIYPLEAIRAIEYCEPQSVRKGIAYTPVLGSKKEKTHQLRLEIADVNNPYVLIHFGWFSGREDPTRAAKVKALAWKALLEAENTAHQLRSWTDTTGKCIILARLIECKDGLVLLRKQDDEQVAIPREKLSEADRALLHPSMHVRSGEDVARSGRPTAEHPSGSYRPSGKCDWWKLLTVALPLSLLAACVLAFVLHLAFIYSVGLFIIPILAGVLLGWLASGLFRWAHCRNPLAAGGFAILLATVMYVGMLHCQHVAVVGPSVLTRIDLLPGFLEQYMQEKPGARNPQKPAPKARQQKEDAGTAIIFGLCGLGWLGAAYCCGMVLVGGARRAYCETCSRWMLIKKAAAGPGVAAEVAAAIQYERIASLPDRREEKCFLASSNFEVEYCSDKSSRIDFCAIYLTATERRGKGTATVARQIPLSPTELDELSKKLRFNWEVK